MANAAIRSKAVVLLLLIHCFMFHSLFVWVMRKCLFYNALLSVLFSFFNHLNEEKRELVALFYLSP